MKKEEIIKYKIDDDIIKNYIDAINSLREPMNQLKKQLEIISTPIQEISEKTSKTIRPTKIISKQLAESIQPISDQLKRIDIMNNTIKNLSFKYPNDKTKIFIDSIKQIMEKNNGILSTRMIEPLNISRQYLSIMEKNNIIEKASRGIYLFPSSFEDSYFSFQQKYKKAVFSHMTALYFYGMTEEFPYNYTITVPRNYHVDIVNEKCDVFYVSDEIYEIGITETETSNGNKVRVYDKERCICDIIRSKGRMDSEQVQKSIKCYMQSNDKNMAKLSEYSKKMGINKKVMEMVGGMYYE